MDIRTGDRVRITVNGVWREGPVLSATNWGGEDRNRPDDWYIEFAPDKGRGGMPLQKYGYWKQGQDGGTVELVSPAESETAAIEPANCYEVWYAPAVQSVRILEDRKAETKKFGTRLVLRVRAADGREFLFSVLSSLLGPNDDHVESIRSMFEGAYRVEPETEKTYLAAWGF